MSKQITPEQLRLLANSFNVELAKLQALMQVESAGGGFLPDGAVKILFERHILWKRLQVPGRQIDPRPLARAHPELCGPSWSPKRHPYGRTGEQWRRVTTVLEWARKNSPARYESYKKAAYESCSYGLFQLMGYHYEAAGYENVYLFKSAHEQSEYLQVQAALTWMQNRGLLAKLREGKWTQFVAGYNGVGQIPYYRHKLIKAYQELTA